MEKSKRSEATPTARMNHEDDHGMNGDSILSQTVCVYQNKENSQGTMTRTTRKRDHKNKQAQLWFNPQRSRVTGCTREFLHASVHCACCCACRSALRVTNSLVVTVPNLFTF